MLHYLVVSDTRRLLLRLLWAEGARDSVSGLARRAGVSFAGARVELEAMESAGLARWEQVGPSKVYSANRLHPHGELLQALLSLEEGDGGVSQEGSKRRLGDTASARAALTRWGAPLLEPSGGPASEGRSLDTSLEEALVEGAVASHHDSTIARVLPTVLWLNRDVLDVERLWSLAHRVGEGQTLGFHLDVVGALCRDRQFRAWAKSFADGRRSKATPYFRNVRGRAVQLAKRNTPSLAKRWHFTMNMGLDSFADVLRKHTDADLHA